jgi:hypothetical protein
MPATTPAPPAAALTWRTHPLPGGRYVRTAVGANGVVLIETLLADRGGYASVGQPTWRCVCIPASIAAAVIAGLCQDLSE